MFPHLRLHVFFPEVQNLPLVVRERSQNIPDAVAAVQNLFDLPGLQRQAFDDRKFQACRRAPVANGRDTRQIEVMLPLRAVGGLDDATGRKQSGFEGIVRSR